MRKEERPQRRGSGTPGMHDCWPAGEEVTEDQGIAVLEPFQRLGVILFEYAAKAIGDARDGITDFPAFFDQ